MFREPGNPPPLVEWLDRLRQREPRAHRKCLARLLLLANEGFALRRPLADSLRDGIHELRVREGTVNYRMLYFFSGQNVAVVSHGLTKEGKIDDGDIDLAIKRRRRIALNFNLYTAEFAP